MKLRVEHSEDGGMNVFVDDLENGVCVHSWYSDKRKKDILDVYATNGDTEYTERKLLVSLIDGTIMYPPSRVIPYGCNLRYKGTDEGKYIFPISKNVMYEHDCLDCLYYTKVLEEGDGERFWKLRERPFCYFYQRPVKVITPLRGVPRTCKGFKPLDYDEGGRS